VDLRKSVGNRALAVAVQRLEDADQLEHDIDSARGGGRTLPKGVAQRLEQNLGADLSTVRVHDDARSDHLARAVSASAFTTGRDIFFRSGGFRPHTTSGFETLAHEATHVVQQAAGPVSGSPLAGNVSVSDPSDRFEREATATARSIARDVAI
jgi:hypothetical protein